MTGLTYSTYLTQIAQMAVYNPDDENLLEILPSVIDYAELRMYRELDFLFTSTSNPSFALTAGNRQLSIPDGTLVVSEQINVITPTGTTNPDAGVRNPLLATTKEFLDAVYGDSSHTGLPLYFVPFNDNLFLVGPFPDQSYQVEIIGTYRPAPLSSSNPTTFISQYLPDVFIMASMIYISGFQRNFGAQADDPQMAQSYERQYEMLMKGAQVEEARKKFESAGWSSMGPSTEASPTRG